MACRPPRGNTRSARGVCSAPEARSGGPRADGRRMRRRRPSRDQQVGSAGVGWRAAPGRARCQDVTSRAPGQRLGEPVSPGGGCQLVAAPGVLQSVQAQRVTGAWEGGSPSCGAVCRALRRRAWTTACGTRAARRRAPSRSGPRARGVARGEGARPSRGHRRTPPTTSGPRPRPTASSAGGGAVKHRLWRRPAGPSPCSGHRPQPPATRHRAELRPRP